MAPRCLAAAKIPRQAELFRGRLRLPSSPSYHNLHPEVDRHYHAEYSVWNLGVCGVKATRSSYISLSRYHLFVVEMSLLLNFVTSHIPQI